MNKAGLVFGSVAYIAAGIVLNFLVSCTCVTNARTALRGSREAGTTTYEVGAWPDGDTTWPPPRVHATELGGYTTTMWSRRANYRPEGFVEGMGHSDAARFWLREEAGWPARAFRQTSAFEVWNAPMPAGYVPLERIDDAYVMKGQRWPIQPVWAGFVMNTLLYAAVVAAVCHPMALGVIRLRSKYLRRRRGLCEGCGYDREGLEKSAACPECGVAV